MCGIIGYLGKDNAVPYLLKGLERLEYRGYDSSGIALLKENEILTIKRKGRIRELEKALSTDTSAPCGIGHTRWATHGEPSEINAHPHLSQSGDFALVHNGIIENADTLRLSLKKQGYKFKSDTDTEVICNLLEKSFGGDIISCIADTVSFLEGSFALAIIHKAYPQRIFCIKKESPLLIAPGKNAVFVCSDSIAVKGICEYCYYPEDYDLAEITNDGVHFFSREGLPLAKAPVKIRRDGSESEKNGFEHYMLKEIYEQPGAFRSTVEAYINADTVSFPECNLSSQELRSIDRIHIVGCGSAYHAGAYGKYIIEELTHISTTAEIASEFRYGSIPLNERSLVVIISQSGETADSLAALRAASEKGARTLCIVNVPGSTMSQTADMLIYTKAGTEVAVATTKAYLCQTGVLYLLGLYLAFKRGTSENAELKKRLGEISGLYRDIESELSEDSELLKAAGVLESAEHIYFIGRHTDYALALEGSLKLKEISYIHCEAYPAGELKHGTISLIEKGTPVIALCLRRDVFQKTLSAVKEVKARGALVIVLTREEFRSCFDKNDIVISVKGSFSDALSLIPGAVRLQLLSYRTAVKRGCDIDKPRNLAKSVTVE